MIKLHVLQAYFGDSMILEYGNPTKYMLIDGGPTKVFENVLKPELVRIVRNQTLDVVVITHIDADHITGILELLATLKAENDSSNVPFIKIKELWLNTFSKTLDPQGTILKEFSSLSALALQQGAGFAAPMAFVANGINQGNRITILCHILDIPINVPVAGKAFDTDDPSSILSLDNMQITFVGPAQKNLYKLQKEWEIWLEKKKTEIESLQVQTISDVSVPNLSSIMFFLEADGKTFLFTGDGRADDLIDGLDQKKLLSNGKLHVHLFKVPHHGSERNVSRHFFETITADVYVISANGKNGNPDYQTLVWIVESGKSQNRKIKLVVTNRTPTVKKLQEEYGMERYGYSLSCIEDDQNSIEVILASKT